MDGTSEALANSHEFTKPKRLRPQRLIIAIALFLFTVGAIGLSHYGWQQSILFLIGGLLGVTLYHSSFGFASAYRKLLSEHQVQGIYAQLVMLAIATLLFVPLLASGTAWGQPVHGAIGPVAVQGAIGAFLFGIGMQLGGVCGCGTLYTLGSGSLTMLLSLITFCLGAFIASLTRHLWAGLPASQPIVLGAAIGWPRAVLVQLVLFGLLAGLLYWWSRNGNKDKIQDAATPSFQSDHSLGFLSALLRGPWPVWAGAIVLAVLNWVTLILSGQPWRVTWGFALWAAQLAVGLGWDASSSPFWSSQATQTVLSRGIFADVSSVMNLGIVLGAMFAAALAGRLVPRWRLTRSLMIGTLVGGLIMGYGAWLAYGCNVSAFLGGIASTSVHGWLWIIFALVGTLLGVRLRTLLRLG